MPNDTQTTERILSIKIYSGAVLSWLAGLYFVLDLIAKGYDANVWHAISLGNIFVVIWFASPAMDLVDRHYARAKENRCDR